MNIGITKRMLSLILAICMIFSIFTVVAIAVDSPRTSSESITEGTYSDGTNAADGKTAKMAQAVPTDGSDTQSEPVADSGTVNVAEESQAVDKTALQKVLAETPALGDGELSRYENYSEDLAIALTIYQTALTNANAVLADPNATQDEVDAALEDFLNAKGFFFVDYTNLEAAIAEYHAVVAMKDTFVAVYYDDYMGLIEEAQIYYLGENAYPFHQTTIDNMTNTIRAAHDNLLENCTIDKVEKEIAYDLIELIDAYYKVELPAHKQDPYFMEYWLLYSACIRGSENLLKNGYYDRGTVEGRIEDIKRWYDVAHVYKEANFAPLRKDLLISADFCSPSVPSGATARMSVTTLSSDKVDSVMIVDETGVTVPDMTVTVVPVNRRQPTIRTLYVDIPMDLEPGTYTFTVYVYDPMGRFPVLLCGDPIECTITVK